MRPLRYQQTEIKVYVTRDYSIFKKMKGNRKKSKSNLSRLVASFKKKCLLRIIIVNEHFEVVDGQHSLQALEQAGEPVHFIIQPGYGLEEVQIYNSNVSVWKKKDFLVSFADQGFEPYQKMLEFMEMYPEFKIATAEVILTQRQAGARYRRKDENDDHVNIKAFEEGEFRIPDFEASCQMAEDILKIKPYYSGFNRLQFVRTMVTLFKKPQYDHKEMVHKMKLQPTAMVDCANVGQYLDLLEQIYNYRRSRKVNLRY